MLDYLARLSRLATRRDPTESDVTQACELLKQALGAEEAYVIGAGDPFFTRLGDTSDPEKYEIKQRGYWLIWHQLAADDSMFAVAVTVLTRLVTGGERISEYATGSHVACILPGDESNSEMLVVRGPWNEPFGPVRLQLLEAARPILATLVGNVLDATRQARQQQQLRALSDVAKAFSDAKEVDRGLEAVATALAKAAGMDWVNLFIFNDALSWIVDRAGNFSRHSDTETAAMGLRGNQRYVEMARRLSESRKPILTPDVFADGATDSTEMLAYYQRAHVLSSAVFPMLFQDRVLGIVMFTSSNRHEFDDSEICFLGDLVSQAATTVKGMRLYQELEEASRIQHFLARTDALTGIPNRRYIEEVLRAECARAQRYSEPVSLVMADLDHFKLINDGFGHDVGDDALKHAADVARLSCREADFVGRWGGDEFIFILPMTPMDGGLAFAERLRVSLTRLPFAPRGGGPDWPMTLSAGVAEAREAGYTGPDELFKLADEALYSAKDRGRDRVARAEPRAAAA